MRKTTALAKTQPLTPLTTYLQTASKKHGIEIAKVKIIEKGFDNQIRKMDSMEATKQLSVLIQEIALNYGANSAPQGETLAEAIRLVIRKFGKLGLDEIKEAYRQYAAGEIKPKGAETYNGTFKVIQIGKILAAYSEKRGKVLATVIKEREIKEKAAKMKELHEWKTQNFKNSFPMLVESKKEEIKSWWDVPVWWYRILKNNDWIDLNPDQCWEVFKECRVLAEIKFRKANDPKKNNGVFDTTLTVDELQKQISRQMIIFKNVIQNNDWKASNFVTQEIEENDQ